MRGHVIKSIYIKAVRLIIDWKEDSAHYPVLIQWFYTFWLAPLLQIQLWINYFLIRPDVQYSIAQQDKSINYKLKSI